MSGKYSSDRSGSDSRAVRTGVDPRVVSCLDEPGGERTLVRLARDIARRETDSTPSPARICREYDRLYHDQLQRLVAAEIVEYSECDGTVRLV